MLSVNSFFGSPSLSPPLHPGLSGLEGLAGLRSAGPLAQSPANLTQTLLQNQVALNQTLLQMMSLLLQLMSSKGAAMPPVSGQSESSSGGGAVSAAPSVGGNALAGGWVSPLDNYKVSSGFGSRKPPTAASSSDHKGLDMAASTGTPIRAAKAGTVTISRDDSGGFGKWVEVKHADGSRTRYAHMSTRDAQVGSQVQAGQVIGKVGSTGNSTGPHLHFEVIDPSGRNLDPSTVLKK